LPQARPADAVYWSAASSWEGAEEGWGGGGGSLPQDGSKVKVPSGQWEVFHLLV